MLRFLLVEKEYRESHSSVIRGLQSMVIRVSKNIHEGGVAIKLLQKEHEALKTLTMETFITTFTYFEEVKLLKQSLARAQAPWIAWKRKSHSLNMNLWRPPFIILRRRGSGPSFYIIVRI